MVAKAKRKSTLELLQVPPLWSCRLWVSTSARRDFQVAAPADRMLRRGEEVGGAERRLGGEAGREQRREQHDGGEYTAHGAADHEPRRTGAMARRWSTSRRCSRSSWACGSTCACPRTP